MNILLLLLPALLLAAAITWLMIRIPLLDHPNHRSSHQVATPRSGGVAILALFLFGVGVVVGLDIDDDSDNLFALIVPGALIVSLVSLYDDITQRAFHFKLLAQLVAVLLLLVGGLAFRPDLVGGFGWLGQEWLAWLMTILWVVGLTNAYNFMDGLDGLAAGVGLIVAVTYASLLYSAGLAVPGLIMVMLACGLAGFLLFNYPPARIFMGDVGSALLGFLFAAIPLAALASAGSGQGGLLFVAMPVLLFHFLFDTLFTLWRRGRAGCRLTDAHREHLYQLLQRSGLSHGQVALIQSGMTLYHALLVVFLLPMIPDEPLWLLLPAMVVQLLYAALVLSRVRQAKLDGVFH
jgi:UDP-GlcNAc:undecaprenyl-phosphate GlcNAc-1-phosphate transferase